MSNPVDNMIADLAKQSFIVFAGSGLNKPNGICDWKALLERLNELSPLRGVNISEVQPCHYPEIAQMIYVNLEEQQRVSEYFAVIFESLEPTNNKWHSVHQMIGDTCSSIITTNLDTCFEAFLNYELSRQKGKAKSCQYQTHASLDYRMIKEPYTITYLHGRKGDTQVIINTTDYNKHYRGIDGGKESPLVDLLKKVFCQPEPIIFVGFSFEDRYVTRTFETAFQEMRDDKKVSINTEKIRHYALLGHAVPGDESHRRKLLDDKQKLSNEEKKMAMVLKNSMALEERLNRINVQVVRYEYNQHVEIHNWFERIGKIRSSTNELEV